jgi:hypothetical protein
MAAPTGPVLGRLLSLPIELLREHIFHSNCGADVVDKMVARQVCCRLRKVVPAVARNDPGEVLILRAAQAGYEDIVLWQLELHPPLTRADLRHRLLPTAAQGGCLRVLKRLCERQLLRQQQAPSAARFPLPLPPVLWEDEWLERAATAGHRDILEWALQQRSGSLPQCCLSAAAKGGHLELLRWLRKDIGLSWRTHEGSWAAGASGNMQVLLWIVFDGCTLHRSACVEAAKRGDVLMLRWLCDAGVELPSSCTAEAAGGGHLEALKWLHRRAVLWHVRTAACAAGRGHLELLQWAVGRGCPWNASDVMREAAMGGHVHVLQWACQHVRAWSTEVCQLAAEQNRTEVVFWAAQHGFPLTGEVARGAALNGNMAVLELLRERKVLCKESMTASTMGTVARAAANGGHLHVLGWLRATFQCPLEGCMLEAVNGPSPDVLPLLEYLVQCGQSLGGGCCDAAARRGRLRVLRWLRERGAEWNAQVTQLAAGSGHLELLQWARTHGAPWAAESVMYSAAASSDYQMLAWAAGVAGLPLTAAACAGAACFGALPMLQWLREWGCPWDERVVVDSGSEELLRWALVNGCPRPPGTAL